MILVVVVSGSYMRIVIRQADAFQRNAYTYSDWALNWMIHPTMTQVHTFPACQSTASKSRAKQVTEKRPNAPIRRIVSLVTENSALSNKKTQKYSKLVIFQIQKKRWFIQNMNKEIPICFKSCN